MTGQVVVFVPDLLFGSKVVGALQSAGLSPVLISDAQALRSKLPGAAAVVVDLTADAVDRIECLREAGAPAPRTLAFYSHVEADVRERAEQAGFAVVVPRSRMAREGAALIQRLLAE